ncbi:MAG: hypothetical protein HRT72_08960 [Flavobacteriales bacterium]|nr:hypothetical protein [Flavobacteriales bacterium]
MKQANKIILTEAQKKRLRIAKAKRKDEAKFGRSAKIQIIIMVIGFLLSIFSIFLLSNAMLISSWGILYMFLIFGTFSGIVYFAINKVAEEPNKLNIPFFIIFNTIGIGGIMVFLVLLLNLLLVSDKKYYETYGVVGTDPKYEISRTGRVVYLLENNTFSYNPFLRSVKFHFHVMNGKNGSMTYDFRRGGFGIPVIGEHHVNWPVSSDEKKN